MMIYLIFPSAKNVHVNFLVCGFLPDLIECWGIAQKKKNCNCFADV